MTGNTFGRLFRVTTCGESYSGCFRKNPEIPKQLYGGLLTIVDVRQIFRLLCVGEKQPCGVFGLIARCGAA